MTNKEYIDLIDIYHLALEEENNDILKETIDNIKLLFKKVKQIDLAHYDSDKSYEGRLYGYKKLWDYLRPGGVLISDDIGDNMAFIYFCKLIERTPTIIKDKNKFQGIIFK